MRVGFIGLGNMGLPMASNLLCAGFELAVWNRSSEKSRMLASRGAHVCGSVAEVGERADVVSSCLADIETSRQVLLGDAGLISVARAGQVVVDHGTVDPGTSRDCHAAFAERGAEFLDAPISGGPEGAKEGTLAIMVGGSETGFETAKPCLDAMGETVLRMGECGAGTATKLANQLLVGVNSLATCEALMMARGAGVELDKLLRILTNAWGQSRMLERGAPIIATRDYDREGAPLRNIVKDLSIIRGLADELDLRLDAAGVALATFRELQERGMGESDMTAACRSVARE